MIFLLLVLVFILILICCSIARSQTFIHILLDMPEQESSILLVQSEVSMIPRRSAECQQGEISDTNKVTPLIDTLAHYNLTTFYFYYYNTSRPMYINKVSFVRWVALQHCSIRKVLVISSLFVAESEEEYLYLANRSASAVI